jgi:hypothetical protein
MVTQFSHSTRPTGSLILKIGSFIHGYSVILLGVKNIYPPFDFKGLQVESLPKLASDRQEVAMNPFQRYTLANRD